MTTRHGSNGNGRPARDYALEYAAAGLSILPIKADGSKRPRLSAWKFLQDRIAYPREITAWFKRPAGVATIGGRVSGNLEAIDFDQAELYEQFAPIVEAQAPGLLARLTHHRTPRPGHHLIYRCEVVEGNQDLARELVVDPVTGKKQIQTLIETRGEGGYFLCPGSPAACHESGRLYEHVDGPSIKAVATITVEERELLLNAARSLNRYAEPEQHNGGQKQRTGGGLSPGDDFAARATWHEIIEPFGWVEVMRHGDITLWCRPGKQRGVSATTGLRSTNGNELLCVFSTNAHPFEKPLGRQCGSYGKFAAYTLLNHRGDFSAAAKALAEQGYGDQRPAARTGYHQAVDADASELTFLTNAIEIESQGADGKTKARIVPLPMPDVMALLARMTDGWPRRVGTSLFVPDHGDVHWIKTPAALFGWVAARSGNSVWHKVRGVVTKEELFEELRRTSTKYKAVELLPHVPSVEGHYYAMPTPAAGDGSALDWLLNRLSYETPIDRDLAEAAFVTVFWGGLAGARPAFVATAERGRGKGKSTLAKLIGRLAGGLFDFDARDDIAAIKTRLLTPAESHKRVALLDNVKSHRFSWAALEALITAPDISGKRMYHGEGTRPNLLTWFITLNGASLSTDMAQRSIIIKLGEPTYTGDWETETFEFIDANREKIIADVVAFFDQPRWALDRFTRWGTWERDILTRLADPGEAQRVIVERRGEADADAEEVHIIEGYFADCLTRLGYNVDGDKIFIPSKVLTSWYCDATNERYSATAVTRALKQMHGERRLRCLVPNKCNAYGNGFVWWGPRATADVAMRTDVVCRIGSRSRG